MPTNTAVNGQRDVSTGGRSDIHRWPSMSPVVANEVPTRVTMNVRSSRLPG